MAEPFGGEHFTHSLVLVLCNRLTAFAVAAAALLVTRSRPLRFLPPHHHAFSVFACLQSPANHHACARVSQSFTVGKLAQSSSLILWVPTSEVVPDWQDITCRPLLPDLMRHRRPGVWMLAPKRRFQRTPP